MKEIAKGDRVKFLNDTGSGLVTRVVNNELVMVSTDDGFEYPVMKSELLLTSIAESDLDTDPEVLAQGSAFAEPENSSQKRSREDYDQDIQEEENPPRPVKPPLKEVDKESKFYKKAIKLREREKAKKEKKSAGIEEVDLHIAQIIDNTEGLSSGEIVDIQLSRFRTSLEGALRSGQKKIVFIHGKGAGKLRRDIVRIIDNEFPRCTHQDASFAEYGYGATMILIS